MGGPWPHLTSHAQEAKQSTTQHCEMTMYRGGCFRRRKKVSNYHVHQKSCTVGTRCLEDRRTPNSMNSCANIPVVSHSDACKFVQSQFSDPGGRAGGTCRCAPHPPPQVLSILRTLAIHISTNKRRRLGFVDELISRIFLCIAHSDTKSCKLIMHPSAHNA